MGTQEQRCDVSQSRIKRGEYLARALVFALSDAERRGSMGRPEGPIFGLRPGRHDRARARHRRANSSTPSSGRPLLRRHRTDGASRFHPRQDGRGERWQGAHSGWRELLARRLLRPAQARRGRGRAEGDERSPSGRIAQVRRCRRRRDHGGQRFHLYVSYGTVPATFWSISAGFDWFFTKSHSLGAATSYSHSAAREFPNYSSDSVAVDVRYGYAPLLFHAARHFVMGFGPSASQDILRTESGDSQNRRTFFGASSMIAGWL